MRRRLSVLLGIVVFGAAGIGVLEWTGNLGNVTGAAVGEGQGCAGPEVPVVPESLPSDIHSVGATIPVLDKRPLGPADPSASWIEDKYVLGLAPHVATGTRMDAQLGIVTGDPALDDSLAALSIVHAEPLYEGTDELKVPVGHLGLDRVFVFESTSSPADVAATLYAHDGIEWVEPQVEVHAAELPNDPYLGYQWHLTALNMAEAWEIADGSGVVVAVLDTGVSAGTDGFAHLVPGRDFIDNDPDATDEHGHGTHVAGTIAQSTNNGIGVAGVAPGATILPVRVLDADGYSTSVSLVRGIIWATDHGAQVMNLSLGSDTYSIVKEQACDYAFEAGVTVVAASGNDSYLDQVNYPAAYDGVLAVGATDINADIAYYSNQGDALDLVAPGGDTRFDHNGDGVYDGVLQEAELQFYDLPWGYYALQGTSMACPHVAGVAALLRSHGNATVSGNHEALIATAGDLGEPGWDSVYGHGMVDPVAALGFHVDPPPPELELRNVRVTAVGPNRAFIRWKTLVPATHRVTGPNGYERSFDGYVNVHKVLVRGPAGATVPFEISSVTEEGLEARQIVDVEFPEAE